MNNLKNYNKFIIISSFSKSLIELFIPIILYNNGYKVEDILLFLLLKFLFSIIFIWVYSILVKKISFKYLFIISSIFLCLTFYFLKSKESIILISLFSGIYLVFYWITRHTIGLNIMKNKTVTNNTSSYTIYTILGCMFAPFIGSLLLDKIDYKIFMLIVFIIMLLSLIPLFKVKFNVNNNIKIKKIAKTFPLNNTLFIFIDQNRFLLSTLFPLYIFLNINNSYKYIGILNIILNIGGIIYIYLLSKKMDKNKKDYLKNNYLFLILISFLKILIYNKTLFLFIIFFESIFKYAVDNIYLRDIYCYGMNYDSLSYIIFIEFLNNTSRALILILFLIINVSLKNIIIILLITQIINLFIKFDEGKYGYK